MKQLMNPPSNHQCVVLVDEGNIVCIDAIHFDTEKDWDFLTVNGEMYSG